jgi:hypothetical protein
LDNLTTFGVKEDTHLSHEPDNSEKEKDAMEVEERYGMNGA